MTRVSMGQQIRDKRKQMGMTMEDLAKKLEITLSFMGHIERDARAPSVDTLKKICLVLDLSADDLLGIKRHHFDGAKMKARQLLHSVLELLED